ncbi:MAG: hypothetical protein M3389_07120 [Actinomycetota bacterium]|nr:hypothetical protein [Actinomycetota bacterium]
MRAADRVRLFEHIVALKRAGRRLPDDEDLVRVRSDIERQLGPTVSRSLAAQILGISHTALRRWVDAGDVPVVPTPNGRREVPVPALVDLYEAVQASRRRGRSHALEAAMQEGRRRAEALDARGLVDGGPTSDPHRRSQLRSLAYHRAVGKRLRRDMVNDARHLLWQWRDDGHIDPRYAEQWEEILRRPLPEIRRIIGEDSPRGNDLRQNSPLAGLVSEPERRRILSEIG